MSLSPPADAHVIVGQAACRLLCRYTQSAVVASFTWWIMSILTCESGEKSCGCSCLKCTWSKLKGCTADKRYV